MPPAHWLQQRRPHHGSEWSLAPLSGRSQFATYDGGRNRSRSSHKDRRAKIEGLRARSDSCGLDGKAAGLGTRQGAFLRFAAIEPVDAPFALPGRHHVQEHKAEQDSLLIAILDRPEVAVEWKPRTPERHCHFSRQDKCDRPRPDPEKD